MTAEQRAAVKVGALGLAGLAAGGAVMMFRMDEDITDTDAIADASMTSDSLTATAADVVEDADPTSLSDAVDQMTDETETTTVDVEPELGEAVSAAAADVVIYTDAPFASVVTDGMSFDNAFAAARREVGGGGGFFEWRGNTYNTYYKSEWDAMSSAEREEYWASIEQQSDMQNPDSYEYIADVPVEGIRMDYDKDGFDDLVIIKDENNDGIVDAVIVDTDDDLIADIVLNDGNMEVGIDEVVLNPDNVTIDLDGSVSVQDLQDDYVATIDEVRSDIEIGNLPSAKMEEMPTADEPIDLDDDASTDIDTGIEETIDLDDMDFDSELDDLG